MRITLTIQASQEERSGNYWSMLALIDRLSSALFYTFGFRRCKRYDDGNSVQYRWTDLPEPQIEEKQTGLAPEGMMFR